MRHLLALLLLLATATAASARGSDGTLAVIKAPHEGRPAIVEPGDRFNVHATEESRLLMRTQAAEFPLEAEWTRQPDGNVVASVHVPMNAPPAVYAVTAETPETTDTTHNAIHVVNAMPSEYVFLHIPDVQMGLEVKRLPSREIFQQIMQAAAEGPFKFCIITGDLTENGSPEEFQAVLDVLRSSDVPTYVCPGADDGPLYDRYFGDPVYTFQYGGDGYLAFDTRHYPPAWDLDAQPGLLQRKREAIKPLRWSIGLTHRYGVEVGMHAQFALFVDDPLDHLFSGYYHRANRAEESRVMWGTTSLTISPAAIDGAVRPVRVSRSKISPGEPVFVVDLE